MHKPRKRFGQNFLVDQGIIQHIVHAIAPQASDKLIEIGPGQAAITKPLLQHCQQLEVIEIDRDLITQLQMIPGLTIHQSDVLKFNFTAHYGKDNIRIIGNLPYNISTPLIIKLLKHHPQIIDMHFMLQKEVVDRLIAQPHSKSYGRLSVIVQYFYDVETLIDVPPRAFNPPPKVNSAFIRLIPKTPELILSAPLETFEQIIRQAFQQRRKTIANNLKPLLSAEQLTALKINPTDRPENLAVSDYVRLANYLADDT